MLYSTKNRFTFMILAIVLILGQFAFVFHSSDVDSHVDDESCIFCLLSGSLDHGLIQDNSPAEILPIHGLDNNWQGLPIVFSVTNTFQARAPPA